MEVQCQCGKRYQVKDELVGRALKCPSCGAVMNTTSQPVVDDPLGAPLHSPNDPLGLPPSPQPMNAPMPQGQQPSLYGQPYGQPQAANQSGRGGQGIEAGKIIALSLYIGLPTLIAIIAIVGAIVFFAMGGGQREVVDPADDDRPAPVMGNPNAPDF